MNKKKQIKQTFEEALSRHKSVFENELTKMKCEEGYPPDELHYQIGVRAMALHGYTTAFAELNVISESDFKKYTSDINDWFDNLCFEYDIISNFDINESEVLIND